MSKCLWVVFRQLMWFSNTNCQVLVAKLGFWDRVLRSFDHIFLAGCVWNGLRSSHCLLGVPLHLPDSHPLLLHDLVLPMNLLHQAHGVLLLTSDWSLILVIYRYQFIGYCADPRYYLIKETHPLLSLLRKKSSSVLEKRIVLYDRFLTFY